MVTTDWIETEASFFRLALSPEHLAKVQIYLDLLTKWNRKVNLTSIHNEEDAIRLHFLESFFAAEQLPSGNVRVVDVGSGAGFPGLAMKIVRPAFRLVSIDSRKKKILFQREVARRLDLLHVGIYPLRLVESAPFLQQADVVCWRGLKLEPKDFNFLKANTSPACLYLCFQGAGERTEKTLEGCDIQRIPIPRSENRTLLLARKTKR
ncbi:MAG TPA: 16S rRNA (guanine(527)-N(7))-methyltransferase RsmG [Acidobacteriota bacterium]